MSDDRLLIARPGVSDSRNELNEIKARQIQMNLSIQALSIRIDALVRGWSGGNIVDAKGLSLTSYYRYASRLQHDFIPYVVAILQTCGTIDDKCKRARTWNDINNDMQIWLDDLMLISETVPPRLATAVEREAMKLLSGTEVFWESWLEMGGEMP